MPSESTTTNHTVGERDDVSVLCEAEMSRLFLVQAHTTSMTGLICLLPFAFVTSPYPDKLSLIIWFAAMMCVFFSRWWWTSMLLNKGGPWKLGRVNKCILSFSVALAGIGWGYAAWRFCWPGTASQIPLFLLMTGILAITPPILSANPASGILFVLPYAFGMILRLHEESLEISGTVAAVIVLIALFTIALSYKHFFNLKTQVMLKIEKDALFDRILVDKKRAEESSYAKGSFIAMMSHEIRTPISGLMGMLEILKETPLDSTQSNYLNTASRSAESLLQLLNDILDYSKIEVGRLELERIPFDWIAMTGEIAMMDRVLASDKGLAFHLEIPLESPSIIVGDPTRLRQILNNLLSNALKFTQEGHIWFRATVENEKADRVIISFSVRDTGIGIDSEAQKKLFQQYQQACTSTSRRYGGSGLGLAISQRLAHLMGGNIRLSSEPGNGSEFTLTVPFPRATPDALNNFIATNQNLPVSRYSAKVLVVEDDPVSQRVSTLMLKGFGITPTVVSCGSAAINVAKQGGFDLIFMDLRLPDMDGYDVARCINAIEGISSEIKQGKSKVEKPSSGAIIVAMTASDTPEDRRRAKESGISEFMPKPVRKRDMRQCLERWIGRSSRKLSDVAAPEVIGRVGEKPAEKPAEKPEDQAKE
jgi:two-component system, sensor histidine kinase